jgi:hypothetical protein
VTFERFPYPLGLVVGVFRSTEQLERAEEGLERAGLTSQRSEVLHGEEDARSLDISGDAHGLRGRLIRALQKASSPDLDHARRHAQYMRDGDYVLAVEVGNDEDAKRGVADALRAAGAEFLNYYGENYIESLSGR